MLIRTAADYGIEAGRKVVQETRGWSEPERRTFSQRSKEVAQDYRYFPEPDLPPLAFAPDWIADLKGSLPELPAARRERLVSERGLSEYQARLLAGDLEVADYLEELVRLGLPAQPAANWMIGEMLPRDEPLVVAAAETAELLRRLEAGAINRDQARAVLDQLYETGKPVVELAAGLEQISDAGALAGVIDSVLAANPTAVADFKAGKEAAIGPLVGKVMQATGGSANPKLARDLLLARLKR